MACVATSFGGFASSMCSLWMRLYRVLGVGDVAKDEQGC